MTETPQGPPPATRHKLPDERDAVTIKFRVGEEKGYMTVGLFPDGSPGELFIHWDKQGSTVGGLLDGVAIAISIGLQAGVPLETYCDKLARMRFPPEGWSRRDEIGYASSVLDAAARILKARFYGVDPGPVPSAPDAPDDLGAAP